MARPKKSTEILKLHGTYRKDMNGDRSKEPRPKGQPVKPDWLSPQADVHWQEVVPGLIETKVATSADEHALAIMCEWWAEWRGLLAGSRVKELGRVNAMATASKQWRDLASRFGLTPSDRAGIVAKADGPKSKTLKHLA